MHKSVQITVFLTPLLQRGDIFVFTCSLARTTDDVEQPWCLYSHGEFLCVLRSNFTIFQFTPRSTMREQCGAITTLYLVILDIQILGVVEKSIYILLF